MAEESRCDSHRATVELRYLALRRALPLRALDCTGDRGGGRARVGMATRPHDQLAPDDVRSAGRRLDHIDYGAGNADSAGVAGRGGERAQLLRCVISVRIRARPPRRALLFAPARPDHPRAPVCVAPSGPRNHVLLRVEQRAGAGTPTVPPSAEPA